jgi:hypothetical protein
MLSQFTRPRSRGSSVSIVTEVLAGRSGIGSRQRKVLLLFAAAFTTTPEPIQRPIQWELRLVPESKAIGK